MASPTNLEQLPGRIGGLHIARAGERLLAWVLALVLLRSAFGHIGNPFYFLSSVYSYDVTDTMWGEVMALIVPYAQLVVVSCLLMRRWLVEAYLVGLVLSAVFVAAQAIAMSKGSEMPCGCFGPGEESPLGILSLAIALSVFVLSLTGWLYTTIWDHGAEHSSSGGGGAP
jgi:hypothetical protein